MPIPTPDVPQAFPGYAVLAAGLIAFGPAAIVAYSTRWFHNRQHTKAELDALQALSELHSEDPEYVRFLKEISKERATLLIFGWNIPNGQLGALMDYYRTGKHTISDLRSAWPLRRLEAGKISFVPKLKDYAVIILAIFLMSIEVYKALAIAIAQDQHAPIWDQLVAGGWKAYPHLALFIVLSLATRPLFTAFRVASGEQKLKKAAQPLTTAEIARSPTPRYR